MAFGIARRVGQISRGVFKVNPGSLLTALQRLERAGWLDAEWRGPNSRRAKYYTLARTGRKQLGAGHRGLGSPRIGRRAGAEDGGLGHVCLAPAHSRPSRADQSRRQPIGTWPMKWSSTSKKRSESILRLPSERNSESDRLDGGSLFQDPAHQRHEIVVHHRSNQNPGAVEICRACRVARFRREGDAGNRSSACEDTHQRPLDTWNADHDEIGCQVAPHVIMTRHGFDKESGALQSVRIAPRAVGIGLDQQDSLHWHFTLGEC